MRYVFGNFILDCDTRQLLLAGQPVPLSPKAFELLELLLRSRPAAVSRTRLTAALWPDTHVGANSLHVLVSQVRAALGDEAEASRWIRTVPRFGYAFAGMVADDRPGSGTPAAPPEAPRLILEEGDAPLQEGENLLGREPGVAVRIDTPGVSRRHARIVVRGTSAVIEDLHSKNGTFVGGERLAGPRPLADGDVIHLGRRVRMVFASTPESRTQTDPP